MQHNGPCNLFYTIVNDGFHKKMSTLAVLVDLKAAYETLWWTRPRSCFELFTVLYYDKRYLRYSKNSTWHPCTSLCQQPSYLGNQWIHPFTWRLLKQDFGKMRSMGLSKCHNSKCIKNHLQNFFYQQKYLRSIFSIMGWQWRQKYITYLGVELDKHSVWKPQVDHSK